jgi:hypothetical protein
MVSCVGVATLSFTAAGVIFPVFFRMASRGCSRLHMSLGRRDSWRLFASALSYVLWPHRVCRLLLARIFMLCRRPDDRFRFCGVVSYGSFLLIRYLARRRDAYLQVACSWFASVVSYGVPRFLLAWFRLRSTSLCFCLATYFLMSSIGQDFVDFISAEVEIHEYNCIYFV